jgi:hypothetical protein
LNPPGTKGSDTVLKGPTSIEYCMSECYKYRILYVRVFTESGSAAFLKLREMLSTGALLASFY